MNGHCEVWDWRGGSGGRWGLDSSFGGGADVKRLC